RDTADDQRQEQRKEEDQAHGLVGLGRPRGVKDRRRRVGLSLSLSLSLGLSLLLGREDRLRERVGIDHHSGLGLRLLGLLEPKPAAAVAASIFTAGLLSR